MGRRDREDVAYAKRLGWFFDGFTGGGHLRFRHPDTGTKLFFSNTTSDKARAAKNSRSVVRRLTPRRAAP